MLESPEYVKMLLATTAGHVMSEAERQENGVTHEHVLPIPI